MTHGKRFLRVHSGMVFDDYHGASGQTSEEYIEPDHDTWTGLYDHNGTPLHRQREPIGYDPHRWADKPKPPKKKLKDTNR